VIVKTIPLPEACTYLFHLLIITNLQLTGFEPAVHADKVRVDPITLQAMEDKLLIDQKPFTLKRISELYKFEFVSESAVTWSESNSFEMIFSHSNV